MFEIFRDYLTLITLFNITQFSSSKLIKFDVIFQSLDLSKSDGVKIIAEKPALHRLFFQALLKKMTSSSRGFPWRSASVFLLLLIGAIVAYDTQKHGSFEASQVGKFLKTSGILKYVEKTWTTLKLYWSAGHKAIKDSSPEYYKAVVDLCAPYVKLTGDICLVIRNISIKLYNNAAVYVERNIPIILDTIEHYAPGILEQIKSQSLQGLQFVKVSFIFIGEKVIEHSSASIQWLEKNVFVGKFSPDNLRGYAIWAFDTTQSYAAQTYDWVYEKVQTLSKVP